ncbi:hypothetical protein H6F67_06945 [Microcoleus sp. FACHB-1515]|nr:hypothetical protein [Microcoleus sp. FACHB-1515]MBD2089587.1 hypothetical protein [Microcoleus sp. FACHB-1515]
MPSTMQPPIDRSSKFLAKIPALVEIQAPDEAIAAVQFKRKNYEFS